MACLSSASLSAKLVGPATVRTGSTRVDYPNPKLEERESTPQVHRTWQWFSHKLDIIVEVTHNCFVNNGGDIVSKGWKTRHAQKLKFFAKVLSKNAGGRVLVEIFLPGNGSGLSIGEFQENKSLSSWGIPDNGSDALDDETMDY